MAVGLVENRAVSTATKVVQSHQVTPPADSVTATVVPLTFFDVLWLFMGPIERLFFYQSAGITTAEFLSSHLPALCHSLSLTLQPFFSLAGRLFPSPATGEFVISYAEGDSVSLLVAESDANFAHLISNEDKDSTIMRCFTPKLPPADEQGRSPVLAVQFTVFPGAGVCLGVSIHHAAADGNSSTRFLKYWAAIHRSSPAPERPVYDRAAMGELEQHKLALLQDLMRVGPELEASLAELAPKLTQLGPAVRTTSVLTRVQIENLKDRIASETGIRPSTFVAACSHVWVCLTKARMGSNRTVYMSFAGDCRARLDPQMPDAYFGNCISGIYCESGGSELGGGSGLVVASKAIQVGIRGLEGRVVIGLREMVDRLVKLVHERVLSITGSPRLRVYEIDFGWGSPMKVEVNSIEENGAMSLAESRDGDGGLEIGLVGPKSEMDRFTCFFKEGLQSP